MEVLAMLGQSDIWNTPGLGSIFLAIVLLCYFVINNFVNKKLAKTLKANNVDKPQADILSRTSGVNKNNQVAAAIVAAITEYRKYNS